MGVGHFDGLVRAAPRTKAVAEVREQRFEKRRQLLQQRLLDQAIQHAGYPQRSDPAIGLGECSPHGRRTAGIHPSAAAPAGTAILLQVAASSSTDRPSAPGAPWLFTTRRYARLRFAGDSTRSISVFGSASSTLQTPSMSAHCQPACADPLTMPGNSLPLGEASAVRHPMRLQRLPAV